jgi:hypothetical protein
MPEWVYALLVDKSQIDDKDIAEASRTDWEPLNPFCPFLSSKRRLCVKYHSRNNRILITKKIVVNEKFLITPYYFGMELCERSIGSPSQSFFIRRAAISVAASTKCAHGLFA